MAMALLPNANQQRCPPRQACSHVAPERIGELVTDSMTDFGLPFPVVHAAPRIGARCDPKDSKRLRYDNKAVAERDRVDGEPVGMPFERRIEPPGLAQEVSSDHRGVEVQSHVGTSQQSSELRR